MPKPSFITLWRELSLLPRNFGRLSNSSLETTFTDKDGQYEGVIFTGRHFQTFLLFLPVVAGEADFGDQFFSFRGTAPLGFFSGGAPLLGPGKKKFQPFSKGPKFFLTFPFSALFRTAI